MASNGDFQALFVSLRKDPLSRTPKDIVDISSVIHAYFESLDLETTKYLSNFAHYISYEKDLILFNINDQADCWFILLSGAVFLKGKTYHAPCSFGKIYDGQGRRDYRCTSVEYCELMKIFYPSAVQIDSFESMTSAFQPEQNRTFDEPQCAINNSNSNKDNNFNDNKNDSSDDEDVDDTLGESFLEFDFSDLANDSFTSITVKDVVQECLEKIPSERTDQDVKILREFLLHFNKQVFNSLQREMQDLICRRMSYVVVEKEGTVVLSEGEEFTYWAFVINGCMEVVHPTNESYNRIIHMGDSFGIDPYNEDATRSQFNVLTRVPSCHYISVAKEDWNSIRIKEAMSVEKETIEDGKKVLVVEEREVKKGGRKGCFVKKGTSEQLIKFLVDDQSTEDPSFVEDFLLTSRVFLQDGMTSLTSHLMLWFNAGGRLRDKSVRIVLLWVNNHFEDFEADFALSDFLTTFMQCMQTSGMSGQLELLRRACCAQARPRKVVVGRSLLAQPWGFGLTLGKESGKVFIDTTNTVSSQSSNPPALLIRGDQVLELNGKNPATMSNKNVLELFNKSLKLELEVKCNFVEHSEALTSNQRSKGMFPKQSCSQEESEKSKKKSEWTTRRLFSNVIEPFIRKISLFGQSPLSPSSLSPGNSRQLVTGSNPDLSTLRPSKQGIGVPNCPQGDNLHAGSQGVLNVYLLGQSKPLSLAATKCQNVLQVVNMALKSLGLYGDSSGYSLFEITFKDDRVVKYSRLPDCTFDLHSRIRDDMRIYLVGNSQIVTNWTSDLSLNGGQDGSHHLLLWHMKPQDVATEVCLRDFQLFRNIQSSEYVNFIFNKEEGRKTENLARFSKLVNEEMFWVATEICSEMSLDNRVKLIQFFLKTAQHCLEMNNFNSMFAILSGLRHNSVSKLKQTWKRVPTKYMKLFESLQDLLDPSNNMSKYRSLLGIKLTQSPAIPFFPIVMKDLTFIDLGNKTHIDGMINYEKMRMIAKQVSSVTNMASPFYHNKGLEMHASLSGESMSPPSTNVTVFATIRKKKASHIISSQPKSEENIGLVKKYFENLKIIQNEEELDKMSLALEPQRHSTSRPKSEMSPQNQAKPNLESKLSASFKFGTDSSQSIQKLIGLTEKISPYQHHQFLAGTHANKKRPNALSLSSYDTLMLTMRKGHENANSFGKIYDSSGKRRDAVILSPTCNPRISKLLPAVRLTSESSSISAPIRYNPTISISKALFAITNQKPFSMTLGPMADKSSVSSSTEELEDLFAGPSLKSQSTPVSPCRSIPASNSSQNGSTPKNISPLRPDNSPIKLNRSIDSGSLHGDNSVVSSEGIDPEFGGRVLIERESSRDEDEGSKTSTRSKRKSLTRQRKEISLDHTLHEFTSSI